MTEVFAWHRTVRSSPRRLRTSAALLVMISVALAFASGPAVASSRRAGGATSGGDLRFGLVAETTDYCLAHAQLGNGGIQVAAAIYDTLTVPNDKGLAVPYLAKALTSNADFTQWTIALRPGVRFQDGEPLDARAIKLNLDTYAGLPGGVPASGGPLFQFYLNFVQSVTAVDPLTVQVTLKRPVVNFPAYLYSAGRLGIQAPAQINGTCSTDMIGTGPFKLASYQQNQQTVVVRNPNYWQPGYPRAHSITFVPVEDSAARNVQLQGGQLDITIQFSGIQSDALRHVPGVRVFVEPPGYREIAHYFLLTKNAPFSNQLARTAFAYAVNRTELNAIRNKGLFQIANSVMDKNVPGYLPNAGYPAFNLAKARQLVNEYKTQSGGRFNVLIGSTIDPDQVAQAQLLQEQLARAGINATTAQFDTPTFISKALAFSFDIAVTGNLYGDYSQSADPDTYIWFQSGSPVNLGGFNDPQIQALLDQGRVAPTAAQATPIYQQFNRLMASRAYLLPTWYITFMVGYNANVKLTFPPLPDGHGRPLFVYGRVPVLGLSKQ
jgi:peptide/nickel transport system substrate-binding protein